MSEAGLTAAERALSKAADSVETARNDVTQRCSQLSGQIDAIGAKWGGQGAVAFRQLHAAWQEKQTKIVRALDDFSESLRQTEKDNVATDEARAQASSNLMNRLG
ncbi:WXG100 family type VII secretion target [Nocardioides campestrisoli]|uniref:WXG100 family type VII secretion target n=1 Tax=Nocardioides campestrisoli TaxID=2736757 RepID=UPI0015E7A9B7|nr:WXG100 family type VII secretion target [Nocardioides campestrisoli]